LRKPVFGAQHPVAVHLFDAATDGPAGEDILIGLRIERVARCDGALRIG
jgi:hypothetical protein